MNTPSEILKEYETSRNQKIALSEKGMYEQNIINRRFFSGDQWYGASVTAERPLVRHNLIKRIGEFKMGELLNNIISPILCAHGISNTAYESKNTEEQKKEAAVGKLKFENNIDEDEVRLLCKALSDYFIVCSKSQKLDEKTADLIKNSFITGTGVLYTYWDGDAMFGKGDLACEILPIENVYFGDSSAESVEEQPYIIIVTSRKTEAVKREAELNGNNPKLILSDSQNNGKTTVYTKLYKSFENGKETIMAISVTDKAYVRKDYDTGLSKYPLNIFAWDKTEGSIYGESEITNLIPNQIAVNRLLTASVWASMYMGMPIMTVNGDTVTEDITNDPGQIIKVYGTNEDVAGAVHYVTPPDFSSGFNCVIDAMIQNTLESTGTPISAFDNLNRRSAAAIEELKQVTTVSAQSRIVRFKSFICETALTFAEFWMKKYGKRNLLIEDKNGRWYFPFDADRYSSLQLYAITEEGEKADESN